MTHDHRAELPSGKRQGPRGPDLGRAPGITRSAGQGPIGQGRCGQESPIATATNPASGEPEPKRVMRSPRQPDSLSQCMRDTPLHCADHPPGRAVSRPVGPKPSRDDCLRWIKRVAKRRRTLSRAEYDQRKPEGAPMSRTLMRWTGEPWTVLCHDAGITAGTITPLPWSHEDKVKSLKAAAVGLDPAEHLTVYRYQDWRRAQPHPERYPSSAAFGDIETWLALCEEAGANGGKKRRRHIHTDASILSHLIAAGDGDAGSVGTTRYEKYRRDHPDAPSRGTIIVRYTSWDDAKAAAVAKSEAAVTPTDRRRRPSAAVSTHSPGGARRGRKADLVANPQP
jgi:hypothetical protein